MEPYNFKKEDALRFASAMNARTQTSGNELQFELCPYCKGGKNSDKKTFSISLESGCFNCFRSSCNVAGNMTTLATDFDFSLGTNIDEYYQPKKNYRKFKNPASPYIPKDTAIKYLNTRGISKTIAEKYEITARTDQPNIIVFPFYDEEENLVYIKYRKTDYNKATDKNKEWSEPNCKPILFGMKQCTDDHARLVITEGQIDSLSVAEAGIDNAVSVPNGANGFTWIPYCWDFVTSFAEIVVFGDYENGNITLLDHISKHFPLKVSHVRHKDYKGCKDANELLQAYGKEAVKAAVENAILLPINRIKRLADVKDINIYELEKVKTGIQYLDDTLYGGLPFGSLVVIAGKRGEGKSTLASQIFAYCIEQGYSSLAYSGELPDFQFKAWLDSQIAGRNHIIENRDNETGNPHFQISKSNLTLINNWYSDKAYIYDNKIVASNEMENLPKTIEQVIQQYGVRIILVDNLMTAMWIDEEVGSNIYEKQSHFVKKLAYIAQKYNVIVLLVAHQRKSQAFKNSDVNEEISGSGDISNLASITIGYNRVSDSELEKGNASPDQRRITICKNRLFGIIDFDGEILGYDEKSKRIYGCPEELDYEFSWNTIDIFEDIENFDLDIPFDEEGEIIDFD